ncbi:hypothetical protein H4R19_001135 [Coemansia spiralis]|nr:hypothetical protein H4R19_001135 [Coemansia spiralis]
MDPPAIDSNGLREAAADWCADYVGCESCVADPGCGFIDRRDACVAGGWLTPHSNFTHADGWSYYHGNCAVSTRVEFVLLPATLALAVLALAVAALWRSWSAPRNSSAANDVGDPRLGVCLPDDHMPLLIDNDPASRHAAHHQPDDARGPQYPTPIAPQSPSDARWAGQSPTGTSLDEQHGSWCHRRGADGSG